MLKNTFKRLKDDYLFACVPPFVIFKANYISVIHTQKMKNLKYG